MSTKEALQQLIQQMPEDRAAEVLHFARFILQNQERREWADMALRRLASAYGEDEPDYSESDVQPES